MRYYPIFLDLRGRLCLVVGGGAVAARKAAALLRCGARLRVVSPRLSPAFRRGLRRPARTIQLCRRRFRNTDLKGCALVIAATDDAGANRAVHAGALRRRIPCNVVDQPSLCTFIAPSILRRGSLTIAVSTGGASPALARRLRQQLQGRIGVEYAAFLRLLGRARRELQNRPLGAAARKRLLYRLVDSRALDLIRRGRGDKARALADSILRDVSL